MANAGDPSTASLGSFEGQLVLEEEIDEDYAPTTQGMAPSPGMPGFKPGLKHPA